MGKKCGCCGAVIIGESKQCNKKQEVCNNCFEQSTLMSSPPCIRGWQCYHQIGQVG
jgi:hypothetical protein